MARNFGDDSPVDEWSQNIHEMIEEMRNRTFFQFRDASSWQPATNIYETDADYHICIELAGLEENQVGVECADAQCVIIAGKRLKPEPRGDVDSLSIHMMEIDEGPFRREIKLPRPIDTSQVRAAYRKGYLWIQLPKQTR